mmetsp:Transcript_62654/g.123869  ORF Transcript_62654/g.123869 Transcript_62654/m.123869 type:complete len:258 (-) Transcript_62654:78-851(-)
MPDASAAAASDKVVVDAATKRPREDVTSSVEDVSLKRAREANEIVKEVSPGVASLPSKTLVVLGMGNTGGAAQRERHSLGARILEAFIATKATEVESISNDNPCLAGARRLQCGAGDKDVALLLLPCGAINDSGLHLKQALEAYGVPSTPFLAVVDDCWLPLGSLRMKAQGSSGGHKGLSNIESVCGSGQKYHRLRVGIGGKNSKEFVTGSFTDDEECKLKPIIEAATKAIDTWLRLGPEAIQKVLATVNSPGFVSQ